MAYFAQQTGEPAKTGRRLRGKNRDTSLWDRDPSAAAASRAPPRRHAQQTTSLWGSEQANGGEGGRTSRPNSAYARTSLCTFIAVGGARALPHSVSLYSHSLSPYVLSASLFSLVF